MEGDGRAVRDIIARADEEHPGRPLLETVMEGGRRVEPGPTNLDEARERARREIALLPDRIQALDDADPPYPVEVSDALKEYQEDVAEEFR